MAEIIDKWVEQAYKELDAKIAQQEDEFVEMFIDDFMTEFYFEDGKLENSHRNYLLSAKANEKFDEAYLLFVMPFLVWFGKKLISSNSVIQDYFASLGIKTTADDFSGIGSRLGLKGNKILKGSYLWSLGMMGEIRQRFHNQIFNAILSTQKMAVFIRDGKGIFKSTMFKKSLLRRFYVHYAYDTIMHTLNTTSYEIALKNGLKEFKYAGGLIEMSRQFCVDRDGNTYTIEEANKWNNMEWRGKIPGVDFFVQCGGYNCRHHLEWITDENE